MIFALDYNNIAKAIAGGYADPDTVNERIDEIIAELKEMLKEHPEYDDPGEFNDVFTVSDEIKAFEELRIKA